MPLSTQTIQNTVDWVRTQIKQIPLVGVGGFGQEPALTIADSVVQEMFAPPFNWKFNRVEAPSFNTNNLQYEYIYNYINQGRTLIGGGWTDVGSGLTVSPNATWSPIGTNDATNMAWLGTTDNALAVLTTETFKSGETLTFSIYIKTSLTAFTLGAQRWDALQTYLSQSIAVTPNQWTRISLTFTVTNDGPVFLIVGGFNSLNGTGAGNADVWGAQLTKGSALQPYAENVTDFGWLESCDIELTSSTDILKPRFPIEVVQDLHFDKTQVGNPEQIAVTKITDNNIKYRISPVPGTQIWTVYPVYQKRATPVTDISQFWPFPDELSFVYRQGFLALAYKHAGDPKYVTEYQIFQSLIMKALGLKDAEMQQGGFHPERPILLG